MDYDLYAELMDLLGNSHEDDETEVEFESENLK